MKRRQLYDLFVKRFDRGDVTFQNMMDVCKRHRFLTGRDRITMPIGTERLTNGGFVMIKVRDEHGADNRKNFTMKHIWLWEQQNGPVPNGHRLKCLDGNKKNTAPSNWECVPNGVLARMHKRNFDDAPAELKCTIIAVSKLEHELRSS
jgi:hypothetical protein